MPRPVLEESSLHPAIRQKVAGLQADIIAEVTRAAAQYPVLVVGMAWNPHVKRAREDLKAADVAHHYLEYGSYVAEWRRRNALKMWTGWPTFPMIFVRGTLIGGADESKRLQDSGDLKRMLA